MTLCGKGIWLAHSYDFQRAVEMATKIEATHLLVKVGHGPHYFPETAREMVQRVRALGFHPLAWVTITDRAPQDAAYTIRRALELGYEAVVLFLGRALVTGNQLQPLATALEHTDITLERLLLAAPPLPHLPDRAALEVLAPLCQGGWMPLCFPTWNESPEQLIDREVYQSLDDFSLLWGATPPIYPVLSPLKEEKATTPCLPEVLIPWVESVMRHGVDFFSVYHAALTEKALWPILQSAAVSCRAEPTPALELAEPGVVASQPSYVTVSTSDTVGGLITRNGLSRTQFWEWNAHLWESRGLPRDPDYLQAGWRVRVK